MANLFVAKFKYLGISVDQRNKDGNSLLHLSCIGCHLQAVYKFLSAKADVFQKDNYGRTPLHSVSNYESLLSSRAEIAAKSLENGANINETDDDGKNALYYALSRNEFDSELVRTLRNYGGLRSQQLSDKDILFDVNNYVECDSEDLDNIGEDLVLNCKGEHSLYAALTRFR